MNERDNKFFNALKERLTETPSPHCDRTFWAKFESEFGKKQTTISWWKILLPTLSSAALILFLVFRAPKSTDIELAETATMMEMVLSDAEMFEELELFAVLEDIELSEEEWNLLLEDES